MIDWLEDHDRIKVQLSAATGLVWRNSPDTLTGLYAIDAPNQSFFHLNVNDKDKLVLSARVSTLEEMFSPLFKKIPRVIYTGQLIEYVKGDMPDWCISMSGTCDVDALIKLVKMNIRGYTERVRRGKGNKIACGLLIDDQVKRAYAYTTYSEFVEQVKPIAQTLNTYAPFTTRISDDNAGIEFRTDSSEKIHVSFYWYSQTSSLKFYFIDTRDTALRAFSEAYIDIAHNDCKLEIRHDNDNTCGISIKLEFPRDDESRYITDLFDNTRLGNLVKSRILRMLQENS